MTPEQEQQQIQAISYNYFKLGVEFALHFLGLKPEGMLHKFVMQEAIAEYNAKLITVSEADTKAR